MCKFFAQGNCRYGNNCKFEHVSDSNQYNSPNQNQNQYQSSNYNNNIHNNNHNNNSNDNYRYNVNNKNNSPPQPAANPFSKIVSNKVVNVPNKTVDPDNISTDQDFLAFISEDFKLWLNSSAWKLSSYKYNKTAMNLPILQDVSNEEARFALWEAKKTNRYNEKLQKFQIQHNQVIQTIKEICNPNQQTREYLLNYFHESIKKQNMNPTSQKVNPFVQIIQEKQQDLTAQSHSQTNLFSQLTSNAQQPVQGFLQSQQTNQIQTSGSLLFTQNAVKPANPFTKMVTTGQSNAVNIPNQVTPIQTGFQNQTNKSLFSGNTQTTQPLFNNMSQPTSQPQQPQAEPLPDVNPDPRIYSNTSDLNKQDLDEFKASHFTLGLIPHCPPSKLLCL